MVAFSARAGFASVYTFVDSGTGNWSDTSGGTWNPSGSIPGASNDVVLQGAGTLVIDSASDSLDNLTQTAMSTKIQGGVSSSVLNIDGTLTEGQTITFLGTSTDGLSVNEAGLSITSGGIVKYGNALNANQGLTGLNISGTTSVAGGSLDLNVGTTSSTPVKFNTFNFSSGTVNLNIFNSGTTYTSINSLTASGTGVKTITNTDGAVLNIVNTLAPGGSAGANGAINFNLTGSSTLNFVSGSDLTMTLGTASDVVDFGSVGNWLTGSGNATLELTAGAGFSYANTYTIFENVSTTGFALAGITGYDSTDYTANFAQNGDLYQLSFTSAPEPSALWLILGGGTLLWVFYRLAHPRRDAGSVG